MALAEQLGDDIGMHSLLSYGVLAIMHLRKIMFFYFFVYVHSFF